MRTLFIALFLVETSCSGLTLPTLPDGRTVDIVQRAEVGLGGRLWATAIALSTHLAEGRAGDLQGKRVIELGCGHGACGLFAAGLGASVLLTDGDPVPLRLAEENVEANFDSGINLRETSAVSVATFKWSPSLPEKVYSGGPYDLVIGSDISYARRSHGPLLDTIATLLSPKTWPTRGEAPQTKKTDVDHKLTSDDASTQAPGNLEQFRSSEFTLQARPRRRASPFRAHSAPPSGDRFALLAHGLRPGEAEESDLSGEQCIQGLKDMALDRGLCVTEVLRMTPPASQLGNPGDYGMTKVLLLQVSLQEPPLPPRKSFRDEPPGDLDRRGPSLMKPETTDPEMLSWLVLRGYEGN
eukprot:CAMPEP_0172589962 /NCGR_PEP_ID=MMETSP1068-20121228/8475_1 /TAXON_ID=35684 /ORGANISM="Pseudopedinella elastica, Strain CCMP716" /LENGTH=353 /DNA_ID=CAMNT_0013385635 /DNA_START=94 /DNA_END=1156 /DNA_ORIENTATION=-